MHANKRKGINNLYTIRSKRQWKQGQGLIWRALFNEVNKASDLFVSKRSVLKYAERRYSLSQKFGVREKQVMQLSGFIP